MRSVATFPPQRGGIRVRAPATTAPAGPDRPDNQPRQPTTTKGDALATFPPAPGGRGGRGGGGPLQKNLLTTTPPYYFFPPRTLHNEYIMAVTSHNMPHYVEYGLSKTPTTKRQPPHPNNQMATAQTEERALCAGQRAGGTPLRGDGGGRGKTADPDIQPRPPAPTSSPDKWGRVSHILRVGDARGPECHPAQPARGIAGEQGGRGGQG